MGAKRPVMPSMCICINTGLLGGFAPIFYFNCEHFLFVYIVKQKKLVDFIKCCGFSIQNLVQIEFCWRLIFEILIIHTTSMGSHISTLYKPRTLCLYSVHISTLYKPSTLCLYSVHISTLYKARTQCICKVRENIYILYTKRT